MRVTIDIVWVNDNDTSIEVEEKHKNTLLDISSEKIELCLRESCIYSETLVTIDNIPYSGQIYVKEVKK